MEIYCLDKKDFSSSIADIATHDKGKDLTYLHKKSDTFCDDVSLQEKLVNLVKKANEEKALEKLDFILQEIAIEHLKGSSDYTYQLEVPTNAVQPLLDKLTQMGFSCSVFKNFLTICWNTVAIKVINETIAKYGIGRNELNDLYNKTVYHLTENARRGNRSVTMTLPLATIVSIKNYRHKQTPYILCAQLQELLKMKGLNAKVVLDPSHIMLNISW